MIRNITVIVIIIIITLIPLPAYAMDSTPSANIKAKLEELKQEIASKAAKLKQEINLKLQNKAFIGTIKTKSINSITLASNTGSKIISLNQDTQYASRIKNTKYSYSSTQKLKKLFSCPSPVAK